MKIGTILNQKDSMRKDKKVEGGAKLVGKNKRAGNYSFTNIQENRTRKQKVEKAD